MFISYKTDHLSHFKCFLFSVLPIAIHTDDASISVLGKITLNATIRGANTLELRYTSVLLFAQTNVGHMAEV